MSANEKYATMEDVARLSGVSKGTVDRVLHDRGDVSEKTKQKVLKAIKEVGYKPNIFASILSMKKKYRIVAVIPYFQKGEYWEMVYDGIMMAESQGKSLNIDIEIVYYNQFDINSFRASCSNTMALEPNGVLIAPIYKEETTKLVRELSKSDIPVVYIDTRLENTEYLAYYGMPLYESGYLAAHLLLGSMKKCNVVNFNIDRGDAPPNDSMLNRHRGFLAYVKDHDIDCEVYDCTMQPNDFLYNIQLFDRFFRENPHISHIITLNSRAYMIAEWMEIRGVKDKVLLGFDMLKKNLEGLRKEYVSTLIAEKTSVQVHQAMGAIMDYLIFRRRPALKDNYVSMDILNKYNVDFYVTGSGNNSVLIGSGFETE